jgi:hypothetical protein
MKTFKNRSEIKKKIEFNKFQSVQEYELLKILQIFA